MRRVGALLWLLIAACRPAPSASPMPTASTPDGSATPPYMSRVTAEPGAPHILAIGPSNIRVDFEPDVFPGPTDQVLAWIERCARAVAGYYGAFPVPWLSIVVRAGGGSDIRGGQTFPASPPTISITVGEGVSARDFERNWNMTHEMVHLAFPNVPSANHWIEEGLATFVEPIARSRSGWLREEEVWAEWIENMPLGQPGPDQRGLDGTDDWGRTYWGGALFCLVADVTLRERSGGRHGLDEALRAIVAAGGTISARWSLDRALAAGDAVTGDRVLSETYAAMKDEPVRVDLDALWRKLGVRLEAGQIRYDDGAPLASVRRAMVSGKR